MVYIPAAPPLGKLVRPEPSPTNAVAVIALVVVLPTSVTACKSEGPLAPALSISINGEPSPCVIFPKESTTALVLPNILKSAMIFFLIRLYLIEAF